MTNRNFKHKYQQLDALRWIAAFSVGMGHSFLCFNIEGNLPATPYYWWTMLFNGAYAVDLFFVLSGFVLINSTRPLTLRNYLAFIARRAARIYPAAWMSLALALSCLAMIHLRTRYGAPWVSGWAEWLIEPPRLSVKNILEVIALTNNRLNPVLWTIAIELVASAFYPLFVPLVRNNHRAALLVAIATGVALSILMPGGMRIFDAAHFLYMFMIGASLNLLQKMEKRRAAALLLLEALLLMLLTRAYGQQHSSLEDLFSTMSSVIIVGVVAFCCPPAVEKLLGHPVMVTLGQSSYSYYLINAPLLYLIVNYYPIFHIKAPDTNLGYVFYSIISGFSAAIVTIPVAIFSAKSFESLSIQWGRRLEEYIVGAAGYSSNSAARLADLGDEMTNQR